MAAPKNRCAGRTNVTTLDAPPLPRTVSAEGLVDLRHPIPDLQTMQGAYLKNVEKLEQSAEELSQGGSDIGEEIRKMKQEQDRASRRSSLASLASQASRASRATHASHASHTSQASHASQASREGRSEARQASTPSGAPVERSRHRNASTSSYSNSIVDVNSAARWGGYSPSAYISSPSVSRVSSFHRPSGLPEPVQEGRPLDSPLASPTGPLPPTRRPSQQSMARTNDELAEPLERHDETKEEHDEDWDLMRQQHAEENIRLQTEEHMRQQREGEQAAQHGHEAYDSQHEPYNDQQRQTAPDHLQPEQYTDYAHRPEHYDYDQHLDAPHQQPEQYDYHQHLTAQQIQRSSTPDTYRQARSLFRDFDGVHFSPTTEEYVELDDAGNEVNRVPLQQVQEQVIQQDVIRPRMPRPNQSQNRPFSQMRPMSYAQPPPGEDMVFYPAPVPRMLNLPKRLSQLPAASANIQAQRRSQVLASMPVEARKSAPWLPALDFEHERESEEPQQSEDQDEHVSAMRSPAKQRQSMMNPRLSRMSMANLPPQLRASVYFDQSSVQPQHEIQVAPSESAVATLDSILAASVNAPVNVFTDHPFAGQLGSETYGKSVSAKRQSSATLVNFAKSAKPDVADPGAAQGHRHNRTASSGIIAPPAVPYQKRNSIVSMLTDLGNPGGNKLKKRNSKMSLATDLGLARGDDDEAVNPRKVSGESEERAAEREGETGALRSSFEQDSQAEAGIEDEEDYEQNQFDERYPFYAQPTTLLAELQLRKAQQKSRNQTALEAFPNGMHSTLLEMDAVKQIEKAKRQGQRTRLAWEDPMLAEQDAHQVEEDEDVPLAVLFPEPKPSKFRIGRGQAADWDKPLGLIERRELEDNEPLSRRRNRLRGISPDHHLRLHAQQAALYRQQQEAAAAAAAVPLPVDPEEERYADEPLAQRLQRLKRKEVLNSALGDLAGEDESKSMSAFTDDVLGRFAAPVAEVEKANPSESATKAPSSADAPTLAPSPIEDIPQEVEPEAETLGQRRARLQRERVESAQTTARPPLNTSVSLANLLAVNPVSAATAGRQKPDPVAGTLLGDSARAELEARKKLVAQNARSTSYNVLPGQQFTAGKSMQNFDSAAAPGPAYYAQQQQVWQQQMYPQMNTGMGYPMQYQQQMYPQFAQPSMGMGGLVSQNMYSGQTPGLQNYNQNMGAGVGAHLQRQMATSGPYAGFDEMQLTQGQRDLIDRWRLSVAQ